MAQKQFVIIDRRRPWCRREVRAVELPTAEFVIGLVSEDGNPTALATDTPEINSQRQGVSTDPQDSTQPATTAPRTIEEAVHALAADPRGTLEGFGRVFAGVVLTLMGGLLGFLIANSTKNWILTLDPTIELWGLTVPLAASAVSIAVFIGVITSAITLIESAAKHFSEFDVARAFFDFIKAMIAILALALSIFLIRNNPDTEKPVVVFPLAFDSSRTVGVFSIFFQNAELQPRYWESGAVIPTPNALAHDGSLTLSNAQSYFKTGTSLAKAQRNSNDQLKRFLAALATCIDREGDLRGLQLSVFGYASSHDFTRGKAAKLERHGQSDKLNELAAWTRARDVYETIISTRPDPLIRVEEPRVFRGINEMRDTRGSVDVVSGEELDLQEDFSRRVDVVVSQSKSCTVSRIARPLTATN